MSYEKHVLEYGLIILINTFFLTLFCFSEKKIRAYCIGQKINNPTTNRNTNQIAKRMFEFYESNKSEDNNNNEIDY